MSYTLVLLLLVPIAGAIVGTLLKPALAKTWALLVSLITLAIGIVAAFQFDWAHPAAMQLALTPAQDSMLFMYNTGVSFSLGVDAVSIWLILLTVGLMPLAILSSFQSITDRPKEYYAWMLALTTAMLGVFVARDALVFYVFFELTLIPMFFIIGIWGGPEKRFAAAKFFLFTFTGGVFTLAAIIFVGLKAGSFDLNSIIYCAQTGLTPEQRRWVLLGLLAGFAVKVPLFPVHTWLPLAHTEAPTAGSVILAGVLLKLGTYGLFRVALPVGLVTASGTAFPGLVKVLGGLCVVGVLYGALVAWVQQDIKKLVAYSSVSHLGFCVLGLFALNDEGMQGSVLYMINHGLSTGAMFLVIGMIYDRYHTRNINELSGLARKMPIMAFFFVFFVMSSIGLPGLNGFASEFLTVLGAFTSNHLGMGYGAMAALGVILGAVYMLHMTARVIFGPVKVPGENDHAGHGHSHSHGHDSSAPGDLNAREIGILVPLALVCVIVGVIPGRILDTMQPSVKAVREPVAVVQVDGIKADLLAKK